MLPQALPLELVDHILDYFHDSFPDLRTCARVCKAWLESSRFHLFHSISIASQKTSYASCRRLYEVIQKSPRVAGYVRELHFSHRDNPYLRVTDSFDCLTLKSVLPQLLQSFERLRKLTITRVVWEFLTPDIRKAFRDTLALPSLVHFEANFLRFSKLEHFMYLLRPHLKRLHVRFLPLYIKFEPTARGREVDKENEQEAVMEREPCRLEYLNVCEGDGFTDWLLGPQSFIDISNLCALDIHVSSIDMKTMKRLIAISGSQLEHLTITVHGIVVWEDPTPYSIEFDRELHLKTLSLNMEFPRNNVLCAMYLFSNLATPSLQQISLRFSFDHNRWGVDTDMDWKDWMEVDRVLNSRALGSLCSVKVSLCMPSSCAQETERRRQKFIEHFPSLMSRGVVEFQYEYYIG